jgi:hypothetical protein
VVFTALGSLAVMGTLISIPIVSQLLGCTPLGPVGWAQALGAAAAATVAMAVVNRVLERRDEPDPSDPQPPETSTRSTHEAPDPALQSARPRRATTARKAPARARSATRQATKLADRPGRLSSSYVRR